MSLATATYPDGTDVKQVIHAKHLLVWVLDGFEDWGRGLIEWLAAVQPLSSSVGETESSKVPETGSLVVYITGLRLEPVWTLGVRNIYMVRGIEWATNGWRSGQIEPTQSGAGRKPAFSGT